jgi:SAM-dependent methyltransferase
MAIADNPWLHIPAADYEAHMGPQGADQLRPLAETFAAFYRRFRPSALAVLGCATGNGLDCVDPAVTKRLAAVDLNPEYLKLAAERLPRLQGVAEWLCRRVEDCALPPASFDMVHAGLLFEYVKTVEVLVPVSYWLKPAGVLTVVLQLPGGQQMAPTGHQSVEGLARIMRMVSTRQFLKDATKLGFALQEESEVPVTGGRRLWAAVFGRP